MHENTTNSSVILYDYSDKQNSCELEVANNGNPFYKPTYVKTQNFDKGYSCIKTHSNYQEN